MSNDAPSDQITIHIDSDDTSINNTHPQPPQQNAQPTADGCGRAVAKCIQAFTKFLQRECEGREPDADAEKLREEEAAAYKKLMSDLQEADLVKPWFVKEVAFHALTLLALVALVAAVGSIVHHDHAASRWRVFHLKVDRWVGLLLVVVSGLPCIRLATFVVSEPLVWCRKWNKHAFFLANKLKRNVDVTLWFTLLLWVWYNWFPSEILKDTRGGEALHIPAREYNNTLKLVTRQVTALLMGLAIGALLWTLKDILYLKLKADLLYDDVCDRIRRTILDLHAIYFIYEKGQWRFIQSKKNKNGTGGDNADPPSFCLAISRLKKENAPTWILERLIDEYMKYMNKYTGIFLDLEATHDDDKLMDQAKIIFEMVKRSERFSDIITRNNLAEHGQYRGEFDHVFDSYKSCEQGDQKITREQFYRWAILALKNGVGFQRTMTGSERIFKKLNVLLSSFVVGLTVVIWLLISRLATTAEVAILFAPFLSATFVFGDSLKTAFNGIVFIFGMHPFDLGDRVIIDGTRMKVSEMKLLTTKFFVYDTGNEIIYPNSDLSLKSITNLDATENMSDSVEFSVPVDTPEDLLLDLRIKIKKSLDHDITFTSDTLVANKEINDGENKVVVLVHFKYLVAHHFETRTLAMSKVLNLIMKLRKEMEKVKAMEIDIQNKQDQYEMEKVTFMVDSTMAMDEIESLCNIIMGILQKYKSSRNCSKVIFTKYDKDEGKIYMAVHIRCHRKELKSKAEKQSIKNEIESEIKAEGGSVIPEQENTSNVQENT